MKFSNKGPKIKRMSILFVILIIAFEIEICSANMNNMNKYHNYLKDKSDKNTFEIKKNMKPNNEDIFDKFRFKSGSSITDSDQNDIVTNSYITEDPKTSSNPSDHEVEVHAKYATAGSEYSWGFLFWSFLNFGASNALSGHNGYWLSKRNVQHDHWNAEFSEIKKIDTIQIHWRLAPTRFKIFYKLDKKLDWVAASDAFSKVNLKDNQGNILPIDNTSSFNTIYFKKPLYCKEVKIMLNQPTKKNSFSIHKVNFYAKENRGIFQTSLKDPSGKNYCFFINSDKPRENLPVRVYPCIDAIQLGTGNELFVVKTNGLIKLINSDLCIGFTEKTKELVLKKCTDNRSAFVITYHKDSTMYFSLLKDTDIYIDDSKHPNSITEKTEIICSSEMDQSNHSKRNILTKGANSWVSSPGQTDVSIQFLFGKIICDSCPEKNTYERKKVDIINIQFSYVPKKFNVFIWTPGTTWRNIASFENNSDKEIKIILSGESASGLMIHMTEGYKTPDFADEIVYGISSLNISNQGYPLKFGDRSSKPISHKLFTFIQQDFIQNSGFSELKSALEKLSVTQEKVISGYKIIKNHMALIDKIKTQGKDFCSKLIGFKNVIGNQTLQNLSAFKEKELNKFSSTSFLKYLVKFNEAKFISSLTNGRTDIKMLQGTVGKSLTIPLNNLKGFFSNMANNKTNGKNSIFNLSLISKIGGDNKIKGAAKSFSFKSTTATEGNSNEEIDSEMEKKLKNKPKKLGVLENPAENCLEMKILKPNILSGFFYIQPECAKKPLRVFCDFSIYKNSVDFYIYKDDLPLANPDLSYLKIKDENDVKFECAKKGLYPLEIQSSDMVSRVFDLVVLDGYNLNEANFIPLGYDFTCKNNRCSKIFNSFNNRRSKPLNSFFPGKIESAQNNGRFVGFGLHSNKNVITFDPLRNKVSGLICSTNRFSKGLNEKKIIQASCEMNISANTNIYNNNSDFIVKCPQDCSNVTVPIYGRGVYHGDSSICKAAIHAGVITGSGGKIILNLQTSQSEYIGNNDYGVSSLDRKGDSNKAFSVKKYKPVCPIDEFSSRINSKQRKNFASFIEVDENEMSTENSSEKSEDVSENTDSEVHDAYSTAKKLVDLMNNPNEEKAENINTGSDLRFKETSSSLLKNRNTNTNTNNMLNQKLKYSSKIKNKNQSQEKILVNNQGLTDLFPGIGAAADTLASGAMNTLNTGASLLSNLLNPKSASDYLKFGSRGDNTSTLGTLGSGSGMSFDVTSPSTNVNASYDNALKAINQANSGSFGIGSGYTWSHGIDGNEQGSSIIDPNYSLLQGKQINGSIGPNGPWTVQSFMGKSQTASDPTTSITNPNWDPISLTLKAQSSGDSNPSSGGSSSPNFQFGGSLGGGGVSTNVSSNGSLGPFLKGSVGSQMDLSNPTVKSQMIEKFESWTENNMSGIAGLSSTGAGGGSSGSGSGSGSASSSFGTGEVEFSLSVSNTQNSYAAIDRIFQSSYKAYLIRLEEKDNIIKKFVNKFKTSLISCNSYGIADCTISNMDQQIKRLHELKFKLKRMILKLQFAGRARIEKTQRLMKSWTDSLRKLTNQDTFKIDFSKFSSTSQARDIIFSNFFKIFKNPENSNEGPSVNIEEWNVFDSNVKSRSHALGIFSRISSSKSLAASFLKVKGKDYFDFKLTVDILFKTEGIGGIAFRVQNEFNYYAFLIDKISGYKAIVKVVNSEVTILKSINDGGILIGNWHTVTINVQGPKISAYIYDKESAKKTNSEKRIDVEDSTFIRGSVALFINNLHGFLFDDLEIEPLTCWSPWLPKTDILVINPNTNLYIEDFAFSFQEKYTTVELDEISSRDGPAIWEMKNDYIENSYLLQKALVYDITGKKRPTFALLKNKYFQNGIIRVDFEAMSGEKGSMSVIFKYTNESINQGGNGKEQFYTFDLVNDDRQSYFFLRKFENENIYVLKQIFIEGKIAEITKQAYEINKKINVIIECINDKISIKISYDDKVSWHEVINVIEESLKYGLVGFGSWRNSFKITGFSLDPPRLNITPKDNLRMGSVDNPEIEIPSVSEIRRTAINSNCVSKSSHLNRDPMGTITDYISILNSAFGKDFCSSSSGKIESSPTNVIIGNNSQSNVNVSVNSDGSKTSTTSDEIQFSKVQKDSSQKADDNYLSSGSWRLCVNLRNESQREKYCDDKSASELVKQRCRSNFCDVCCEDNVFRTHKNLMHNCKKACYKSIMSSDSSKEYENVCINSEDHKSNIYSFCQTKMDYNQSLVQYCKLDMCNLCCVSMDAIKKKSFSVDNLKGCFRGCSKEFNVYGITVDGVMKNTKSSSKSDPDFNDIYSSEEIEAIPSFRNDAVYLPSFVEKKMQAESQNKELPIETEKTEKTENEKMVGNLIDGNQ